MKDIGKLIRYKVNINNDIIMNINLMYIISIYLVIFI